jgi:hypothetical protein
MSVEEKKVAGILKEALFTASSDFQIPVTSLRIRISCDSQGRPIFSILNRLPDKTTKVEIESLDINQFKKMLGIGKLDILGMTARILTFMAEAIANLSFKKNFPITETQIMIYTSQTERSQAVASLYVFRSGKAIEPITIEQILNLDNEEPDLQQENQVQPEIKASKSNEDQPSYGIDEHLISKE